MTAPSDPAPDSPEAQQEIVLRLGDILPRVPAHLLKPGPHDTNAEIRFSVDELAEKISRGRVNVPLERFSSIYPHIFRHSSAFPGEQVVPLPLQKLLDQIGLMAPRAASANGIPAEQITRARASASRLLQPEESDASPAQETATPATAQEPASPPRIARAISTARNLFGRLGLVADYPAQSAPPTSQPPTVEPPAVPEPAVSQPEIRPEPAQSLPAAIDPQTEDPSAENDKLNPELQAPDRGTAQAAEGDAPTPIQEAPADIIAEPQPSPMPISPALERAAPPQPEATSESLNAISVRALPIFRLLSPPVLKNADLPADDVRIRLPLSAVDPQLEGGHVEIPVEDFVNALPPNLRSSIDPVADTKIWIPLDEIFQNLPVDHLYYMPAFDAAAAAEVTPAATVEAEPAAIEQKPVQEKPTSIPASESTESIAEKNPEPITAGQPVPEASEPALPADAITVPVKTPAKEPEITAEKPVAPEAAPKISEATPKLDEAIEKPSANNNEAAPAIEATNVETIETAPVQEAQPPAAKEEPKKETPVVAGLKAEARFEQTDPESIPNPEPPKIEPPNIQPPKLAQPLRVEAPVNPQPLASTAEKDAPAKAAPKIEAPVASQATAAPQASPAPHRPAEPPLPSRAPWMRGFQVPPPRLFGAAPNAASPPAAAAPSEPPPVPAPATPEAKRTADFLASEPGIFAAVTFVEDSLFASDNFPDQPDLQAVREFITLFVDCMGECGHKLDWRHVITLPCGKLHLTAAIRGTHFVAAIHHDRLLAPLAYDALIEAADDLAKSAAPAA